MILRNISAVSAAVFLASATQFSFAQSQEAPAPSIQYRCGEAFDPKAVVGKTFHGPFQWEGGVMFYAYVTFNADCTVTTVTAPSGSPKTGGQWGQNLEGIIWEPVKDGATVYKGSRYTDGSIRGIMGGRGGYKGSFTLNQER